MVFTKILHIATSLFYFANSEGLRKTTQPPRAILQTYKPRDIAPDYIPINEHDTFFISYRNNLRKDVRYVDNKFEEVN